MFVYDTPFAPVSLKPSGTTAVTLHTVTEHAMVSIHVTNPTGSPVDISIGFTPNGGSLQQLLINYPLATEDAMLSLGPFPIPDNCAITVETETADSVTFLVTGMYASTVG